MDVPSAMAGVSFQVPLALGVAHCPRPHDALRGRVAGRPATDGARPLPHPSRRRSVRQPQLQVSGVGQGPVCRMGGLQGAAYESSWRHACTHMSKRMSVRMSTGMDACKCKGAREETCLNMCGPRHVCGMWYNCVENVRGQAPTLAYGYARRHVCTHARTHASTRLPAGGDACHTASRPV